MSLVNIRPTPALRTSVFLAGDLAIWLGALLSSFLIRFDGVIPDAYVDDIPVLLLMLIPIKLAWSRAYRLYQLTWRSVGLSELIDVLKANTFALVTVAALTFLLRTAVDALTDLPRSVLLLDYVLTTGGVSVFRLGRRGWRHQWDSLRRRRQSRNGMRLLIVGAGAAGSRIVQSIKDSGDGSYHPIGFIDDDPLKVGTYIHGVKVLSGRQKLPQIVRDLMVEEALVAIPSASSPRLREIVADLRATGIQRIKVLPGMHEWLAGRATLKDVREINVGDLLGRPPVRIQYDQLKSYLTGKRILVTGAAGSIGSELVRQLSRFEIGQVVAADINESALFELEEELKPNLPHVSLTTSIADVRDGPKMDWLISTNRPHVIFHAAAYKHLPVMERQVEEAVKTNVFGTLAVGESALRHGVETFVFISTDKAVNPTSAMGASKRVGELVVQALNRRGRTRFVSVRFGNVLGSRGSLIPVLQEQIRRGGPVTVTHPDMTRYFMSIAEAVLLVLQTPLLTVAGSTFVLDMGEPVRIYDLVQELIRLSGLEVDKDIPIVFSGIREGEKLNEELWLPSEQTLPTPFDRILEIQSRESADEVTLRLALRELEQLVQVVDSVAIRALLDRLALTPSQISTIASRTATHASG